jgi:NADH-quinone oxidoreductase subunit L
MTFYGTPRGDKHTHANAHESPPTMLIPLGILALGAIFSGMLWFSSFFGHTDQVAKFYGIPYSEAGEMSDDGHGEVDTNATEATHSDGEDAGHGEEPKHHYVLTGVPGEGALYMAPENTVMEDAHKVPYWVKTSPFVAMLIGFATAWLFYVKSPHLPGVFARNLWPLHNFLLNKWYFDEIYNFLIVNPLKWLGAFLWKRGDGNIIDGGINGLALGIIPFITRLAGRAQSGYLFHYAFAMVLGITILVTWAVLKQAGAQ